MSPTGLYCIYVVFTFPLQYLCLTGYTLSQIARDKPGRLCSTRWYTGREQSRLVGEHCGNTCDRRRLCQS